MIDEEKAQRMATQLDGRLDAARQAALFAELDASPDDLELLADAAAVLGELEAMEHPGDLDQPETSARPDAGAGDPPTANHVGTAAIPTAAEPPSGAAPVAFGAALNLEAEVEQARIGSAPGSSGAPAAAESGVIALDVERTRRRSPGWKAVLPIAALVAGLSVLPFVWKTGNGDTDPGVYAHQGTFGSAGLPAGWNRAPWSATRGADDGLSPRARAVRLGVAITDLELAVAASDPRAAEIAGDVQRLLEPIPAAGAISQYYDGIAAGQVNGGAAEDAVRKGRVAIARLPDAEMVSTGAWLEAARLAAARRDAEFFATRESRERLKKVAAAEEIPAAARTALSRSIADASSSADGWTSVDGAAASVLELVGR